MADLLLNLAHRGASAWAPENTLAAFRLALELGAHGFELDVQLSRDDQPVVIHDGSVDRTTNGSGRVAQLTLAELKKLDAGTWFNRRRPRRAQDHYVGEPIPTLAEIFELVRRAETWLYLELKFARDSRPGLADRVVQLIAEYGLAERVVIESFQHEAIRQVKQLAPHLRTSALIGRTLRRPQLSAWQMLELARAAGADEVALDKTLATARVVRAALAAELPVVVWTVNSRPFMRRGVKLGLKGVITNYPDRLTSVLRESKAERRLNLFKWRSGRPQ